MAFSLSNLFSSLKTKVDTAPKRVVGIDIGSAAIKVVELESTDRSLVLRTYGELQLGPYGEAALGDLVNLDEKGQTEALVDVIREANVQAKTGIVALPLSSSFVTVITITTNESEDIAAKIPVEARKYIPVPMNDIVLDWSVLPPIGKVVKGTDEVLLAAIQSDSLKSYNTVTQALSLQAQPSEIEVFSTIRSLRSEDHSLMAVIDLGARVSKLYISRDGNLERIHRVSTGGVAITKKIAELKSISFAEAENLKRATLDDSVNSPDIRRATQAVLGGPLQEFKRIIDVYEERVGAPLDVVYTVGGVASGLGVSAFVGDTLGKSVSIGNPFKQVAYPAFMEDTITEIAPIFAVSLGAALRTFYEG